VPSALQLPSCSDQMNPEFDCLTKVQGTLSPNLPVLWMGKWDLQRPAADPQEAWGDSQDRMPLHIRENKPQLIGKMIFLLRGEHITGKMWLLHYLKVSSKLLPHVCLTHL